MGDYDNAITVNVPPGRLFDYLADVEHLPAYLPRLRTAHLHDGDRVTVTAHIEPPDAPEQDVTGEAWIRVLEHGTTLEWGAPGPSDYHGRLRVTAGDAPRHLPSHRRAAHPADRGPPGRRGAPRGLARHQEGRGRRRGLRAPNHWGGRRRGRGAWKAVRRAPGAHARRQRPVRTRGT
ncbi:hypothetical protein GCM10020295_04860 [Streptomyces cinereospinus]